MEIEPIKEDFFQTITLPAQGFYKEKGSKFYAYAYAVSTAEEIKEQLDTLKKEHFNGRHFCYAYRINPAQPEMRINDDGEPGHSAGTPIYHQILSHDLWNIMVVVVRYFGGSKLGIPGLINAYKTAAEDALQQAGKETQYLLHEICVSFEYPLLNEVLRILREENIQILEEEMYKEVKYRLGIRKSAKERSLSILENLHGLKFITSDYD